MSPVGNITSRIYSTLGSDNSLMPLFIKDTANSMGLTGGAYITGDKLESKNRFIDEFGTQAIWLFGIPVYKKAIDLTLFKAFGLDPKVDVRNFKNKEIFEKAKEYAKKALPKMEESLIKAGKNEKTMKTLAMTKFAAATALTIVTYLGLTDFRQKFIKDEAKKEILKEHNNPNTMDAFMKTPAQTKPSFEAFLNDKKADKKDSKPSFTGLQDFIFNPVKNLMIVDAVISGQRIVKSTDDQDRLGFIVKEAGFWAFMYLAKAPIQEFLEKNVAKKHKLPIDLDSTVIESDRLKQILNKPAMLADLKAFSEKTTDVEIYDFIHNNRKNIVVEMAEKCDVIPTVKQNWVEKFFKITPKAHREIDSRKYIDIEEVKKIKNKLEALNNACEEQILKAADKDEAFEQFMKKVKTLKRNSTFKNIGACIAALGIVVPAIMVALRYLKEGNKEFKVKEELEKEMAAKGEIPKA